VCEPGIDHRAVVAQFLADHTRYHFCSSCIAGRAGLGVPQVRDGLLALSREIVVDAELGPCFGCGRDRMTYALVPKEIDAPDEALTLFLKRAPGFLACHTCLARQVKLTAHETQKSMWRLRASGQVQYDECRQAEPGLAVERLQREAGRDEGAQRAFGQRPVGEQQALPPLGHDPRSAGERPRPMRRRRQGVDLQRVGESAQPRGHRTGGSRSAPAPFRWRLPARRGDGPDLRQDLLGVELEA
jgi:hypothetical protein